MINMLHGDLGTSYKNNLSVWSRLWSGFLTQRCWQWQVILVAILIGILRGIISAKKQYSMMDNTAMLLSLIGIGHA